MTDKTVVISARVPVEVADRLRGENLRQILTEVSEGKLKQLEEVPPEILDDMRVMVELSGGSFRTFMIDLHKKLDNESLELLNGRIKTTIIDVKPYVDYLVQFLAACDLKNMDVGDTLRIVTNRIVRNEFERKDGE